MDDGSVQTRLDKKIGTETACGNRCDSNWWPDESDGEWSGAPRIWGIWGAGRRLIAAGASPEHRRSIPGTWSARYALTRLSITQTSNWLIIDIDYRLINSGRPWTANPTPGSKYSLNYRLTRVWNIDTLKGRGGEGRGGGISPHHPRIIPRERWSRWGELISAPAADRWQWHRPASRIEPIHSRRVNYRSFTNVIRNCFVIDAMVYFVGFILKL